MLIAEEKYRGPFHKHDNVWAADRKNGSPPSRPRTLSPHRV